jgi:uncharacterized protein
VTADIIVSIVSVLLVLVGIAGIIVPILPGSMLILASLLLWAIVIGGPVGWITFAVGGVLVGIGMSASWVLTGSRLKARAIPNSFLLVAGVCGLIGMFVIPVVGLPLGFVLALFLLELNRHREAAEAWASTWTALKGIGLGMLIEFATACLALLTLVVGLLVRFV